VRDVVHAGLTPATRAVVLDAQTAPFIDVTATSMLTQLAHDLGRRQVTLAIAHPLGQTRDVLRRAGTSTGATLRVYPDVDAAVRATRGHQDEPTSAPRHPTPPASSPTAGEAPRRTKQ
jgi:MFS superfamily sulfate permease-like transporter